MIDDNIRKTEEEMKQRFVTLEAEMAETFKTVGIFEAYILGG